MHSQILIVCMLSMIFWQASYAFVIQDPEFTIGVLNSTESNFEKVTIAASSAVVIDDDEIPSIKSDETSTDETSTGETDQKKPNIEQVPVLLIEIEKTGEICPDNDVKSTVENEKEENESHDPLDDHDEELDKPHPGRYPSHDEVDEDDDHEDDD